MAAFAQNPWMTLMRMRIHCVQTSLTATSVRRKANVAAGAAVEAEGCS